MKIISAADEEYRTHRSDILASLESLEEDTTKAEILYALSLGPAGDAVYKTKCAGIATERAVLLADLYVITAERAVIAAQHAESFKSKTVFDLTRVQAKAALARESASQAVATQSQTSLITVVANAAEAAQRAMLEAESTALTVQ